MLWQAKHGDGRRGRVSSENRSWQTDSVRGLRTAMYDLPPVGIGLGRYVSISVCVLLLAVLCLGYSTAIAQSDVSEHVVVHGESHDVTFKSSGRFVALCGCVSPNPSVLMCAKAVRLLAAMKAGDKELGIEKWNVHGTMKANTRVDLRHVCYYDMQRSATNICCGVSERPDLGNAEKYYYGKLQRVEEE